MAWDRLSKGPWLRYAVVPLLPCCAAALRVELLGGLMLTCPYLTFYPAVMLAALLGGFGERSDAARHGLDAPLLESLSSHASERRRSAVIVARGARALSTCGRWQTDHGGLLP